jgi:hypothetical protein
MTYGLPVQRNDDPLIHLSDKAFAAVAECGAPGNYLVNIMPILKYIPGWVPGTHFKQVARQVRKQLDRVMEEPYEMTLKNIVQCCFDNLLHHFLMTGSYRKTEQTLAASFPLC